MIRTYFGLPGSGKTTLMASHALKYTKRKDFNVYCNVPLNIPKVIPIDDKKHIGKYRLHDGVILIDEATVFADSRKFKDFSDDLVKLFCYHRHFRLDIELYSQGYDRLDKTIRTLTDKVYWIRKVGGFTFSVNVPMDVFIPKRDVADEQGTAGEIVNGYYRPSLWSYLFCEKIWRRKYYPYFDSFNTYDLPELPDELLRHNLDTCNTNVDYDVDEIQLKKLIKHFEELTLPSPDDELVDISGTSQVVFNKPKKK